MKYRVREIITKDGQVYYYPQKQFLFFWCNFKELVGEGDITHSCFIRYQYLWKAKEFISREISRNARIQKSEDNKTIVASIIHPYP